jgi:hypothetical protein
MKNVEFESLPDFPALQQIQRALWSLSDTRGAAVLVGAGFSRNAILPSPLSPTPPLWSDFADAMKDQLYPGTTRGHAPQDPLRLAQEFKAMMGSSALDDLIHRLVPDKQWLPGALHHALVNLPWTDILTTNWDTLVERAADGSDRTYEVVRTVADIPRTRAPRIVKLHGSMPSHSPFIFTEEDYRTYPHRFGPFVNLVQQVLMENELCLIGFSGDDPNFLQWSGWIRDQLRESARRIYLIGALDLSPSRRKYLESRNVTPVDFAPLLGDVEDGAKHTRAYALFLDFLEHSKPPSPTDWPSAEGSAACRQIASVVWSKSDTSKIVQAVNDLMDVWRRDHSKYPGWLVCPASVRARLRLDLGYIEQALVRVAEQLLPPERAELLYETAWRFDLALWDISGWLRDRLVEILADPSSTLIRARRCELGLILLRLAREERKREEFDRSLRCLKNDAAGDSDIEAAVAYETALWNRDHLDYVALTSSVPLIAGQDPAWRIRRAGLHYDLGQFEIATEVATAAVEDARNRYLRDRKSIWAISRHAWALLLLYAAKRNGSPKQHVEASSLEEWPDYFSNFDSSPWDELDALDSDLSEAYRASIESSQPEQAAFDPGIYITSVRLSNAMATAANDVRRCADVIGLPCRIGNADLMQSRFLRVIEVSNSDDDRDLLFAIRVLGGPTDKVIEIVFNRIRIAQLSMMTVENVIEKLQQALLFGLGRVATSRDQNARLDYEFWIIRTRVMIELLSRLAVRLADDKAKSLFTYAASLANTRECSDWRLFEPLGHLISRSFKAISLSVRWSLMLSALTLPLPDERGISANDATQGAGREWPDLFLQTSIPRGLRSEPSSPFDARISILISKVKTSYPLTRERAAMRLLGTC